MSKSDFGHCDTLDYFPLKKGIKPSMMGLRRLNYDNPDKNKIFQIDEHYYKFLDNKRECLLDDPTKYVRNALGVDLSHVEEYIGKQLRKEYPNLFPEVTKDRVRGIDSYAKHVPEDLVVHCFNEDRDWAEYINLCHANGWSAEEALNWTFDQIHAKVPRMDEIGQGEKVKKMMNAIVKQKVPMERIAAISFRTDSILNRHPKAKIIHKPFCIKTNPHLFIRFERQTVVGFEKVGVDEDSPSGFLFTIRTYFVDVSKLEGEYLQHVRDAFDKPNPKVYSYEFLKANRDQVLRWIDNGFKGE